MTVTKWPRLSDYIFTSDSDKDEATKHAGLYVPPNIHGSTLPDNQFWKFDLEPVEFIDIKWDLSAAAVFRTKAHCVGDKVMLNSGDMPLRLQWVYPENMAWMGHAVHTSGFPLRPDFVIKSGLPTLDSEKELIVENRPFEWKMGPLVQITSSHKKPYAFEVKPRSSTHLFVLTTQADISVPFVLSLRGKTSGVVMSTNGVWSGSIAGHYAPFGWHNHCTL